MDLDARRIPIVDVAGTDKPEEVAELQAKRPVCPVTMADGTDAWLVTGYEEVRKVLTDPRFQRDPNITGNAATKTPVPEHTGPQMRSLDMDGQGHTEIRSLVSSAFSGRAVRRFEPRIQEIADSLLDDFERQGSPADLASEFARPFPVAVICDILGISVSADEHKEIRRWIEASMSLGKYSPEEMQQARIELFGYFQRVVAEKREAPADDLLTALITACYDDRKLSELEMLRLAITVFVAGHETTVNAINLGVWRLLQHPDQFAMLRDDPDLVTPAVEELLRFQFHPTVGIDRRRFAAEDVTLGENTICAGDVVIASVNAANQDRHFFSRPDRFDITRTPNPHLSFGDGPHYCLGAALARAELIIAVRSLSVRFPGLRLAEAVEAVRRRKGLLVAGLERLPVAW
uniref:Putative P450 n=1 Tax=Streptomyces argenteolus TaxID=67274 RepID=A9ZNV6_9ACTN|nr:putative P450 [Streptomyces argenteolus]